MIRFDPELRAMIYHTVVVHGPIARDDLCKVLDLPRTTVFDNLQPFIQCGMIETFKHKKGGRGRPLVHYQAKLIGREDRK